MYGEHYGTVLFVCFFFKQDFTLEYPRKHRFHIDDTKKQPMLRHNRASHRNLVFVTALMYLFTIMT